MPHSLHAGFAGATYSKSSYSGGGGGCVEVAFTEDAVAVRDTKDRTIPPHVYTRAEWDAFLKGAKDGEFDGPA